MGASRRTGLVGEMLVSGPDIPSLPPAPLRGRFQTDASRPVAQHQLTPLTTTLVPPLPLSKPFPPLPHRASVLETNFKKIIIIISFLGWKF